MELARVNTNFQIEVSNRIKEWIKTEKELAVFIENDMLILKKFSVPDILSFDDDSEEAMPLSEINEEVHKYRKERKL